MDLGRVVGGLQPAGLAGAQPAEHKKQISCYNQRLQCSQNEPESGMDLSQMPKGGTFRKKGEPDIFKAKLSFFKILPAKKCNFQLRKIQLKWSEVGLSILRHFGWYIYVGFFGTGHGIFSLKFLVTLAVYYFVIVYSIRIL